MMSDVLFATCVDILKHGSEAESQTVRFLWITVILCEKYMKLNNLLKNIFFSVFTNLCVNRFIIKRYPKILKDKSNYGKKMT